MKQEYRYTKPIRGKGYKVIIDEQIDKAIHQRLQKNRKLKKIFNKL